MTDPAMRAMRAAKAMQQAQRERDDAIRELRAAGWPLRAIADLVDLSHVQVKRICDQGQQDSS